MEITVRGRNHRVPKALHEFAVKKLEHLGKYLSTITSIDVELYQDGRPRSGTGKVASITVSTSGPVFRAKADSEDMKASIDTAYVRLERQVKEFKRKRSGRPLHSRKKAQEADTGIREN